MKATKKTKKQLLKELEVLGVELNPDIKKYLAFKEKLSEDTTAFLNTHLESQKRIITAIKAAGKKHKTPKNPPRILGDRPVA